MISAKNTRLPFVCLGLLLVVCGCSGRKVTTSIEDQSLLHQEQVKASSMPGESATSSETPVVSKSTSPSSVSPQTSSQSSLQQFPAGRGQSGSPQAVGAPKLPADILGDVFFDFDRAMLRPEARATLEGNAKLLKGNNDAKVLIEGHCDERGTLAYNLVLGERRAQSVKRYLQELGVPVSQLQITSYGKERPFCLEHRETCWQRNRRGHFVPQ